MALVRDIAGSRHRLHDCLRLALVWVAGIDDAIDAAEIATIRAWLPDLPGGVPLERIVGHLDSIRRSGRHGDLVPVFDLLRMSLADASRDGFLRLVVDVAAADGRIATSERHALMFLADLLDRAELLPACYEEATGEKFTLPADLADPAAWDAIELADSRTLALATLGLGDDAGAADIRDAWRRLAAVHHPDRYHGLDPDTVAHATAAFQRIEAAYRQLVQDGA